MSRFPHPDVRAAWDRFPHPDVRAAWDRFPRQHARTRRFSLGEPRGLRVAPDGSRLTFLRSAAGDDARTLLWALDLPAGTERCVLDPQAFGADDRDLPPEERARRERVREAASGVVSYATDRALARAVTTLAGQLVVADLAPGGYVRAVDVGGAAVDPTLSPDGDRLAFVRDRGLWVADVEGGPPRRVVAEDDPDVTWGLAEFVAAEEMGRTRGYWWAPDGKRLAVARVDVAAVRRWWITDPAEPGREPQAVRYPAAGTANADVRLTLLDLDGRRVEVDWDRDALPYLAVVRWDDADGPLLAVQSRDQRTLQILVVDPADGRTRPGPVEHDPAWVDLLPGTPRRMPGGGVLHGVSSHDTRRLAVDGEPITPPGLHVRAVSATAGDAVLVSASADDPTSVGVWRVPLDGGAPERLTPETGVHGAVAGGDVVAISSRALDRDGQRVEVRHPSGIATLDRHAETPALPARPRIERVGSRDLSAALLLPHGYEADEHGPLPVLLDPYGGPHHQRVLQAAGAFGVSQWFADAGFAVLVADGRGTPGRGLGWERAIAGDLASAPLTDQVDALHAVAERHPGVLDLGRVAIRGWSFGGYLAALAVLRRPDVFHAAVAGAPVADWTLYDTHYTERYLGDPTVDPEPYRRSSLLEDAARLERPLLLVHGLADDNVVAAHTLRLSRALLEAGRPHQVLPLVGVTHMTPQEVVAENLLRLELGFLRDALG